MKHKSIKNKLRKAGFEIHEYDRLNGCFYATKENNPHIIEWSWNGGNSNDCVCLNTRKSNDISDSMTDYHAGSFSDTIKQALAFAAYWSVGSQGYHDTDLVKFAGGTWLQDKIDEGRSIAA